MLSDNCDDVSADIVFVVDNSGSIADADQGQTSNWQLMKNFIIGIVQQLDIGADRNRVGMVTFGNEGYNEFFLEDYTDSASLVQRINETVFRGENTNTSGGLRVMREQQFTPERGDRANVENVAIVITDGRSTYDNQSTIPEAILARAAGIEIIAIGVTGAIDEQEVMLISSLPQQINRNYFLSAGFSFISEIMTALVEATCQASEIGNVTPQRFTG